MLENGTESPIDLKFTYMPHYRPLGRVLGFRTPWTLLTSQLAQKDTSSLKKVYEYTLFEGITG